MSGVWWRRAAWHGVLVSECLERVRWLRNGRTDGRTDGRTYLARPPVIYCYGRPESVEGCVELDRQRITQRINADNHALGPVLSSICKRWLGWVG